MIVSNINNDMKLNNSIDESYWAHDEDVREFSGLNKIPYIKLDVKHVTEKEISIIIATISRFRFLMPSHGVLEGRNKIQGRYLD